MVLLFSSTNTGLLCTVEFAYSVAIVDCMPSLKVVEACYANVLITSLFMWSSKLMMFGR